MKRIFISVLLISFLTVVSAFAQDAKTQPGHVPEDPDFQKHMKEMAPMFGNVTKSMMQGRFAVLSEKDTVDLLAKFAKNYYDALVNVGFNEEQALKIVISVGVPTAQ